MEASELLFVGNTGVSSVLHQEIEDLEVSSIDLSSKMKRSVRSCLRSILFVDFCRVVKQNLNDLCILSLNSELEIKDGLTCSAVC